MPNLVIYNQQGEQVGQIEAPASLFKAPLKKGALYHTVVSQTARQRQGTASTRTRSQVRGGGSKPWPQKGTGRARHGSIRSPIWTGGGVTFGPQPRNFGYKVPKKVRRAALSTALSSKNKQGKVLVMEGITLDRPHTKGVVSMLNSLKVEGKALFVTARPDHNLIKSARNIPGVSTTFSQQLNVLDILNHDYLIFTREALQRLEEVYGG
ncbi:MAG TPA: 50S ribosomal protein L4 [Firmicutes bacterium]|nr:50S ribosomal protein L4 [Bacillota bacterium]